jgi:beta-lactamase superfamily II metal-dependent hydrolase
MRAAVVIVMCLTAGMLALLAQTPTETLNIYYIDTEGGQSTLLVGPTGESLLVDTGNAGDRDLGRIVETLKAAGVKQIDHMWTTHYHGDHVGALLALSRQFPIMHFYDHGKPHANDRIVSAAFLTSYEELSQGKRTIVKPGDKVRMNGLDITTVASANQFIRSNLAGGGSRNATCAGVPKKDESAYPDTDNGDSAGFVLTYGRFRTVDLGDLTWNGELDLMCPTNRIGTVDLYLTSHHGLEKSGAPALVHALQPRVAVMNNGTRKGGTPDAFRVLHESPGLEDLWQLHWSYNVGLDNAPALFVANVDDNAAVASVLTGQQSGQRGAAGAAAHSPAYLIKVAAGKDGTFTVTNTRNGFSKAYKPRP